MWNIIQSILGSLCVDRLLINLDTFTNPELDFFLDFIITLLFIHVLDSFEEIPEGLLLLGVVITTPELGGIEDVL